MARQGWRGNWAEGAVLGVGLGLRDTRITYLDCGSKREAQAVHLPHDISHPFSVFVFDNRLNLMLYSFTKADESIRLVGIHHNDMHALEYGGRGRW